MYETNYNSVLDVLSGKEEVQVNINIDSMTWVKLVISILIVITLTILLNRVIKK